MASLKEKVSVVLDKSINDSTLTLFLFYTHFFRRKVLEAEMASLKEKVSVVLDKSINDSKLISALRAEIATQKRGGSGGRTG